MLWLLVGTQNCKQFNCNFVNISNLCKFFVLKFSWLDSWSVELILWNTIVESSWLTLLQNKNHYWGRNIRCNLQTPRNVGFFSLIYVAAKCKLTKSFQIIPEGFCAQKNIFYPPDVDLVGYGCKQRTSLPPSCWIFFSKILTPVKEIWGRRIIDIRILPEVLRSYGEVTRKALLERRVNSWEDG